MLDTLYVVALPAEPPKKRFVGYVIINLAAVKIMEAQVGSILKETDIVRYQDIYGRVK